MGTEIILLPMLTAFLCQQLLYQLDYYAASNKRLTVYNAIYMDLKYDNTELKTINI